jgi:uncharacterized protein (TIGR02117 family)
MNRTSIKRGLRRIALAIAAFLLLYTAFLLLGFVPVNGKYKIPPEGDRVRLFIRSNDIHTDLVLPVVHAETGADWRGLFPLSDFAADVSSAKYIAVGWGNRGFFVETPRWSDLKLRTLLGAIFPSESVLHAEYVYDIAPGDDVREIWVTRQQYQELADYVCRTVGKTNAVGAALTATEVTYGSTDRFYTATGHYHLFNTCNQWTGRGLKRAGLPIGVWTPIKAQVLCWLPHVAESSAP